MPPVEIDQLECSACEEITSCAMDQKETKLSCRGQPLQFHGSMSFGSFGQASFQWLCRHSFMAFLDLPWISGRGGCLWELQLHALQRGNGEDRDFAKVGGPSPGCLWCWYRLIPISSTIHCISLPCENLFFWFEVCWKPRKSTIYIHLPFASLWLAVRLDMDKSGCDLKLLVRLLCSTLHGSSLVPVSPGANINVKYDHLFLERYHTCYIMLL